MYCAPTSVMSYGYVHMARQKVNDKKNKKDRPQLCDCRKYIKTAERRRWAPQTSYKSFSRSNSYRSTMRLSIFASLIALPAVAYAAAARPRRASPNQGPACNAEGDSCVNNNVTICCDELQYTHWSHCTETGTACAIKRVCIDGC